MTGISFEAAEDQYSSMGYWSCSECGSEFFGGGKAMHRKSCSKTGYTGLVYHYTQTEVKQWNAEVMKKGYAAHLPLSPVGLSDFLLKEAISQGKLTLDQVKDITARYAESVNPSLVSALMTRLDELLAIPKY